MPIKKSDLYSSIWKSCDELRGGMDAWQKVYDLSVPEIARYYHYGFDTLEVLAAFTRLGSGCTRQGKHPLHLLTKSRIEPFNNEHQDIIRKFNFEINWNLLGRIGRFRDEWEGFGTNRKVLGRMPTIIPEG